MTLKKFKKAIALGNGLPFVRIKGKFPTHFSPAIFEAATRNLAYDAQFIDCPSTSTASRSRAKFRLSCLSSQIP